MLRKFNMTDCKPVSTSMEIGSKLVKDDDSPSVNQTSYRSMIGSLLYVKTSRPDKMQASICVQDFSPILKNLILIQ